MITAITSQVRLKSHIKNDKIKEDKKINPYKLKEVKDVFIKRN